VKLDSTLVDIAVGNKDKSLVVAATFTFIAIITKGNVAYKHPVKYQPTAIACSPDDTKVAVGGKDNQIYLYSLSGGKLSDGPVLKGHRGALSCLTYSPDGKYLASADLNREIFVWDTAKNEIKVQGWVFHTARVNCLSWAPDAIHLASGSLDGCVFVWDVEQSGKRLTVKGAHSAGVNACVWVDGNTVATAGQDCTLKTWSVTFY